MSEEFNAQWRDQAEFGAASNTAGSNRSSFVNTVGSSSSAGSSRAQNNSTFKRSFGRPRNHKSLAADATELPPLVSVMDISLAPLDGAETSLADEAKRVSSRILIDPQLTCSIEDASQQKFTIVIAYINERMLTKLVSTLRGVEQIAIPENGPAVFAESCPADLRTVCQWSQLPEFAKKIVGDSVWVCLSLSQCGLDTLYTLGSALDANSKSTAGVWLTNPRNQDTFASNGPRSTGQQAQVVQSATVLQVQPTTSTIFQNPKEMGSQKAKHDKTNESSLSEWARSKVYGLFFSES